MGIDHSTELLDLPETTDKPSSHSPDTPRAGLLQRIKDKFGSRRALEEIAGPDNQIVSPEEINASIYTISADVIHGTPTAKYESDLTKALRNHVADIREGKVVFVQVFRGYDGKDNDQLVRKMGRILPNGDKVPSSVERDEGFYRTKLPGVYRYEATWKDTLHVPTTDSTFANVQPAHDVTKRAEAEFIVLSQREEDLRRSANYNGLARGSFGTEGMRVVDSTVQTAKHEDAKYWRGVANQSHDEYMEKDNRKWAANSLKSRGGD